MPPTKQEISLLINPLVPESVQHNNRVRPSFTSPHLTSPTKTKKASTNQKIIK